jgi:hypothetical protein
VPTSVTRLLADLAVALRQLRLRWYVFGAQAVVVHGRPRLTEDVDVTVDLDEIGSRVLVQRLATAGFDLAEFADDEFVDATRVLPFVHKASGMALDVVLAGPGLEQLFLDGAEEVDLDGIIVPVIRVEHLLVTKILAARPKDLDDVREILHSRDDIDLKLVRELLRELEIAIGEGDLVAVFDDLVASKA